MKYTRILSPVIALVTPLFALAQGSVPPLPGGIGGGGAFDTVIAVLTDSINIIIVFLFLVATVIFLWGIVRYISAGGDEGKIEEARNLIIWGIIFLAVMVAVWGFVYVVLDFIFGSEGSVPIPDAGGVPQQ